MSNNNAEQMKKIIADKKNNKSQQGPADGKSSKLNAEFNKGFKKTKRAGSLNKQQ